MKKLLKFILNLIYPAKCVFCGTLTDFGKEIFICDACKNKIAWCESLLCCKICGKPQQSLGEKNTCYVCLNRTYRAYKKAVAVVKYDKLTSAGVKRYKNGTAHDAGVVFAEIMASRLEKELSNVHFDCMVGVAPSRERSIRRGIDPVGVLCEGLEKLTKITYEKDVLVRIKRVPKQSTLNFEQRMKNMIGVFGLKNRAAIEGKTVLLIDDVMTTGATANECAYILKKNGAKTVYVLTLATTVKEPKTYN